MRKLAPAVGSLLAMALTLSGFASPSDESVESSAPRVAPSVNATPNDQAPTILNDNNGFRGIRGQGMGGGPGAPGYSATWYPTRPVSGQDAELGMVRQHLAVGVPIWREEGGVLLLTAGVRNSLFFTDAILPDSGRPFPETLWNISTGLSYMHQFDCGWSGGLSTNYGSASDKPFHSIDEMYVSVFGFLRIPVRNDRDAWMFSVMYSPAGNLNFPIPGIAYNWRPSDDLHVNIGLPFTVMWKPADDWTVNFFYIPLTNINARLTYALTKACQLYGGYEFLNEAYFLADRIDTRDRFMGFEQRLIGGACWDLWTNATLDVNAGYAFNRYYGEGRNQGDGLTDRVDIAPGGFIGANLRLRF